MRKTINNIFIFELSQLQQVDYLIICYQINIVAINIIFYFLQIIIKYHKIYIYILYFFFYIHKMFIRIEWI
jgi:hypothetical protein